MSDDTYRITIKPRRRVGYTWQVERPRTQRSPEHIAHGKAPSQARAESHARDAIDGHREHLERKASRAAESKTVTVTV